MSALIQVENRLRVMRLVLDELPQDDPRTKTAIMFLGEAMNAIAKLTQPQPDPRDERIEALKAEVMLLGVAVHKRDERIRALEEALREARDHVTECHWIDRKSPCACRGCVLRAKVDALLEGSDG